MGTVTTPDGVRTVAFAGAPALAVGLDLFGSAAVLGPAVRVIELVAGTAAADPARGIAALLAFGYALLAHRRSIPSLGQWCLALERYGYAEIEEYSGKGVLYVQLGSGSSARLVRRGLVVAAILGLSVFIGEL